jgi:uncharacterized membrane protein YbhN (UPF0104 family)
LPLVWIGLTIALAVGLPGLPWQRALDQVRRTNVAWMLGAVFANLLILPLWAAEWRLLAPGTVRVAYARMFEVVAITAAILNSVPFFAGEASAVALLIGRAGLSRGAALSVLAMDQLLVGLGKLAVLAAAAVYAPLPTWLRTGVLSLAIGVVALLSILLPLAHRWDSLKSRLLAHPSGLRRALARAVAWGAHLDAVRQPSRIWRVASLALAKKTVELIAILAVQVAFGLEPSVAGGLLILAGLSVTTLLPVAPANVGVYEATVFAIYRYLGVSSETALGLAVVQHVCFLLPALATGYLTLTLRQLLPRRLRAS